MSANKFELSSDKDRRDFERRQHIWWDMIGSIQCACEKERRKIARRMKDDGITTTQIAEANGLTAEEIDGL